ncbi:MAG: lysine--tRNA ligase [Pyrinomonadaceae bacterium]
MSVPNFDEIIEQNDQTAARLDHLNALRELVGNVYPNKFVRSTLTGSDDSITALLRFPPIASIAAEMAEIVATLAERERPPADIKEALNARLKEFGNVRIAGRLAVPPRVMGKAAFVHLSDGIERLQIYIRRDDVKGAYNGSGANDSGVSPDGWEISHLLDHGDFVGVDGYLFITNTGELSVHVEVLQFLAKAMVPMPDKMHGIADAEIKQRQRYVDLIGSSLRVETQEKEDASQELSTREVFERRAKVVSSLRHFLDERGYIEVETPMLTPKATGAAATPFETHHNALDIKLYARIAPELYLKRLLVGGFEKVYELNRNFRNEGISYKHNPEFTMLEFYCAYMDVNGMMDFCEEMLRESVEQATGGLSVVYEGTDIDFGTFRRISMKDAICEVLEQNASSPAVTELDSTEGLLRTMEFLGASRSELLKQHYANTKVSQQQFHGNIEKLSSTASENARTNPMKDRFSKDELLVFIFDQFIESTLLQPTFIIDYPKSISPLAKASPGNPQIAERFELFINGMEVANGFSELNDPKEQYDRFTDQMGERERGDEEAMVLDEDYIRALSYGMPPAAGIGIGIDRLVMLLTNKHSIRDVILFPHMRPERKEASADEQTLDETSN